MAVVLLTDFGVTDVYTGVMKGVISGINPDVQCIDLTHGIEPQNVRQAALALLNSVRYFPAGTVFVVVVDPGVGSRRRPIAVEAGGYYFVAPDNGVVSYIISTFSEYRAIEIAFDAADQNISNTFHGRDIFAPTGARLSKGQTLEELGKVIPKIVTLPYPQLVVDDNRIVGEIIHIDRFGNIVTSIGRLLAIREERLRFEHVFGNEDVKVRPVIAETSKVKIGGTAIQGIRRAYSDVERGSLLALVGSNSFLEISVNQGNAAQRLDVAIGDRVELEIGEINAAVRN